MIELVHGRDDFSFWLPTRFAKIFAQSCRDRGIYGFDNRIFTCIDLSNGKRKWKGGLELWTFEGLEIREFGQV